MPGSFSLLPHLILLFGLLLACYDTGFFYLFYLQFKHAKMKAFETNRQKTHWVRIKEGRLCYWNGEKELLFDEMQGILKEVYFKDDEYQGRKYTEALFTLYFDSDKYILSVNTATSYFRSFCNYLRNADLRKPVLIRPRITERNGKNTNSIFVQQNGKWLKAFYTKDNPGNMPQMIIVEVAGKKVYDNSQQIEFWKYWLLDEFKKLNEDKIDHEVDDLPF